MGSSVRWQFGRPILRWAQGIRRLLLSEKPVTGAVKKAVTIRNNWPNMLRYAL